jgi:hypothetical protein
VKIGSVVVDLVRVAENHPILLRWGAGGRKVPEPRAGNNRSHFDLYTADPEGNPFCVIDTSSDLQG